LYIINKIIKKTKMKKIMQKIVGYVSSGTFAVANLPDGKPININTLEAWIERISVFMLYVGGTLAVIFIIWGGISYMVAGGNEEKVTKARTRLKSGIIGAAIILGVGLILQTINNFVLNGL